jgi:hypothetical protein
MLAASATWWKSQYILPCSKNVNKFGGNFILLIHQFIGIFIHRFICALHFKIILDFIAAAASRANMT